MNTKSSIFTSGEVKIPLCMFMSDIKKRSYTEKVKFSISFMIEIAAIQFISMRPFTGQRHNFFPSRCASNLMLPVYLLGILLVLKIARNYV